MKPAGLPFRAWGGTLPYVGGFDKYVAMADERAAKGYEGFKLQ